jgi:hypothetical protein
MLTPIVFEAFSSELVGDEPGGAADVQCGQPAQVVVEIMMQHPEDLLGLGAAVLLASILAWMPE